MTITAAPAFDVFISYTSLDRNFFSVMLYVGKPKWGAFTRLETRTKESNRHAREKILLPVLLSY